MVLCPFVHLILRPDTQPLILQPAEVDSAHWVSLRALMSPHLRTFERSDVSDRFFHRGNKATKRILRAMVGQLLFTARKLVPTESTYSRSISDYIPPGTLALPKGESAASRFRQLWQGNTPLILYKEPPLILWGLTYGILANFVGLMPSDDPPGMWDWPTLSPWDIRFIIWIVTYRLRANRLKALRKLTLPPVSKDCPTEASLGGMDSETFTASAQSDSRPKRLSSVDTVSEMLDGYFERLRTAIWIALAVRVGASTLIATLLFRRYRRRRYQAHL